MTQPNRTKTEFTEEERLMHHIFEAEPTTKEHECNFYCRDDVHAHTLYCDGELDPLIVAVLQQGQRFEIVDFRLAPEIPPIDPSDPAAREWTHRYVVWSRP